MRRRPRDQRAGPSRGAATFDMGAEDARKLVEFSADLDAEGAAFALSKEIEIARSRDFGWDGRGGCDQGRGGRGGGHGRGGGGGHGRGGGGGGGHGGGGYGAGVMAGGRR